jgi:predicted MFS family arabinose efflux permease
MSLIPGLTGRYLPLSRAPRIGADSALSMIVAVVMVFVAVGAIGLGWLCDSLGWLWPALGVELAVMAALHPVLLWAVKWRQGRLTTVA